MGGAFSCDSWRSAILKNVDQVATCGNNEKTKVMIVSPDVKEETKFVQEKLKTNDKTNRISFEYFQVPDKTGKIQDKAKFLEQFKLKAPTVVVLAYQHNTIRDQDQTLNNCPPGYAPPDSVPQILQSGGYFSKIICSGPNYLFLETLNVWHLEECILTSLVEVTGSGVREQLEKAVHNGNLVNSSDSRVLIVSAGHGGNTDKNGRVTPAGSVSCFSDFTALEYGFYEEDCKLIGIQPGPDICRYKILPDGSKEVIGIQSGVTKPSPGPKPMSNNADPSALLLDGRFNAIQYDVLNIAHFGAYNSTSQGNVNLLVDYLQKFNPTHVIIGWCFSSDGDLAMTLRRFGIFPKIILEHDMRMITKDPKAKLSAEQIKVLKMAALDDNSKRQFKDFHLAGGHGCGKTSLAVEITKTVLVQLLNEGKQINLLVFAKGNRLQTPVELLKKLESELKPMAKKYGVQSFFEVLGGAASNFTVTQFAAELKKKISQLKEASGANQDVATIVLTDEISAREGRDRRERNFATMPDMGPNVHSIYCHSPIASNNFAKSLKFNIHLPKITPGFVYSQFLSVRYRNNIKIYSFLNFLTENNKYFPTDFLLNDNDMPGVSLPPALPGSPHPVLWLDCNWDWMRMDNVTMEMIEMFVAEAGVSQIQNRNEFSRLIINDDILPDDFNSFSSDVCEGIEAEIVVALGGGVAVGRIEALSRARNQLIIISGTELMVSIQEIYLKAEGKKMLLRKQIETTPDYFVTE